MMGSTLSIIKTLFIPALISLVLFLVLTYLVLPLWRYYRNRYSQYLPLDSISTRTTSLRIRTQDAIGRWITSPFRWRRRAGDRVVIGHDDESEVGFSSEEGEELGDVHEDRRHALSLDSHQHADSNRRLSRDLEQGFRDDSDDDDSRDSRNRR